MEILSSEKDIAERWGTEIYVQCMYSVGEQDLFDKMKETKTWLAELKFKAV